MRYRYRRASRSDDAALESFYSSFTSSLVPSRFKGSGTPTFTRATTATELDFDGKVVPILSGEVRFGGARREHNRVTGTSEDFTSNWLAQNVTAAAGQITDGVGVSYYYTDQTAVPVGAVVWQSYKVKAGTKSICWILTQNSDNFTYFDLSDGSVGTIPGGHEAFISVVDSDGYYRIAVRYTSTHNVNGIGMANADGTPNYTGDGTGTLYIKEAAVFDVTGRTNQTLPEYVSVGVESAPYHGAGVDGVKWFEYENGNTVAANVVTEAQGAAIAEADLLGAHREKAATNKALYSRTWENAAWVASNITPDDDSAVGVDGLTRAATLTATAGNGTIIQDLGVIASAAQAWGLWIKRKTGTGDIEITLDGGSTWTAVTVTAGWTRVQKTQTLADPDIGIRIVTSGDAIYVDFAQCETGTFLTSTIPETQGTAVTRNIDVLGFATAGNLTAAEGTIALDWTPTAASMGTVFLFGSYVDASNYTAILHDGTNMTFRKRIGGVDADAVKALAYVAGTTYTIAATAGASGMQIYVDGVAGTADADTADMQLAATFQIGTDGNGATSANGYLNNVRIFARALSAAQIGAL